MKPHESPKLLHHKIKQNYKETGKTSSPQCQVIALSYALLLFPTICSRKKKRHKNYNYFLNTLSKQLEQNIKIKKKINEESDAQKASRQNQGTRQILSTEEINVLLTLTH